MSANAKKQKRIVIPDFIYKLDRTGGSGLIGRLVQEGGPWGYVNPNINDANFPVTGSGIVGVRFKVIHGKELMSDDGRIWRNRTRERFRRMRMRFPNPAEGLLPLAEDHQLGLVWPVVVFLFNTPSALVVRGDGRGRDLDLCSAYGRWFPGGDFLGVCE